jgi:hypothetical protein
MAILELRVYRRTASVLAMILTSVGVLVAPGDAASADVTLGRFIVSATSNIHRAGHEIPPSSDPTTGPCRSLFQLKVGRRGDPSCSETSQAASASMGQLQLVPTGGAPPLPSTSSRLEASVAFGDLARGLGGSLVGVFTSDFEPQDPAPMTSDYRAEGETTKGGYAPSLDQVFFIGDGLAGTEPSTRQFFYPPFGATRLWLGFFDAPGLGGKPSAFAGNTGAISVTVGTYTSPDRIGCLNHPSENPVYCYAPLVKLHPKETYRPTNPSNFIRNSALVFYTGCPPSDRRNQSCPTREG